MRGNPALPMGNTHNKSSGGVTDGFSRRSGGHGSQMQQTFLSGKESMGQPYFNSAMPGESIYSANP